MKTDAYTARRVGTTGHEIRDPDGNTICRAATEPWAALIAFCLNRVEEVGLSSPARNAMPPTTARTNGDMASGARERP